MLFDNTYENSYYKLYLDCDLLIKNDRWVDNHKEKIRKLLYKNINDVIEFLKNSFNYTINKNEILVCDASGIDEEFYKCSYHISLPIYALNIEDLYDIFTYLNNNVFTLKSNCFQDKNLMDTTVYVKNHYASRKWRLPYNSKNGHRPLIPIKLEDLGYSEKIKDHLCVVYLKTFNINIIDISKIKDLNNKNMYKKGYTKEIFGDNCKDIYNLNIKPSNF